MNRILLVRLGALGDVVHAIPVAAALHRAFPSARIDWLVGAKHRAILDLVPVIDRRLVIDGESAGGTRVLRVLGGLRRSRYDVAIDLAGADEVGGAGARVRAPIACSASPRRICASVWRGRSTPTSTIRAAQGLYDPRETRHVVEINLGLLQPLGIPVAAPEFPIARVESEVAADVCRRTGGRYALLNPGAQWPNKRWPPARFGGSPRGCASGTG